MATYWYAMQTKPNKEDFLAWQLEAQGFKVFYPRINVKPVNPRSRKVRSYFPGYLFVQVDLTTMNLSMLQWVPGAVRLVSFGGEACSVPEALILAIWQHVEKINSTGGEFVDGLKSGDAVEVQEGPFAGYRAIFDSRISGSERVRVLIKLLQDRQVLVNLPANQIKSQKSS